MSKVKNNGPQTGKTHHVARDNLDIHARHDVQVVLIYLDPSFNSNRTYSAPIGSEAAGAAFEDM